MILAPFFATLSAIIPKLQNYFITSSMNARDQTNRLRWISGENFICAILKKGNFFYICLYNFDDSKTRSFLDDNS